MMTAPDFITLGVIAGPHGVKGAVKIRVFSDSVDDLFRHESLTLASGQSVTIKKLGVVKGHVLAQCSHIHSREDAERAKGQMLGTALTALPETSGDEFYHHDLIGLKVVRSDGEIFGTVEAVHNFGAGDIVEIRLSSNDKTELFSFTHLNFPEIDRSARRMVITPPDIIKGGEA